MAEWERKQKEFKAGEYAAKGLATVKCGKTQAKITFIGVDKAKNPVVWDDGSASKVFHAEDLPKTFVFEPGTEAEYYVCTSFDKASVFSIGPWEGSFDCVPYDISRNRDTKEPTPFESHFKDNKTGAEVSQLKFKLLFKIVEPDSEFKGCVVPYMQVYLSDTAGLTANEKGQVIWAGVITKNAVWQPRLEEVLGAFHVTEGERIMMPEDGNCLPEVWKRIEQYVEEHPKEVWRMKISQGEIVGFSADKGKRKVEAEVEDFETETPKTKLTASMNEFDDAREFEKDFPATKPAKKVKVEEDEDL